MDHLAISVLDLSKTYSDGTVAVDGLGFEVKVGEVFGLLGPNGAGKTTTIQMLVGLMPANGGEVMVAGHDVSRDAAAVKRAVGFVSQGSGVDLDYTVEENLLFQGQLHGMSVSQVSKRCEELLRLFRLEASAGKSARHLSGGTRRKVDVALALVHAPSILFLDEPTAGLDLQTRRSLWDYLRDLSGAGVSVFLTTQYLEEADQVSDHLVIINEGRLVVQGTPGQLKQHVGGSLDDVFLRYTGEAYRGD